MLVKVLEILSDNGKRILAESEYGCFRCNYCGSPQCLGDAFFAEIDVSETARSGHNFFPSSKERYEISEEETMLSLCCTVDAHDDDGIVALRIGGSIFLVEYVGRSLIKGTWHTLTISNRSITLYNIGL
jgi:hypothetical protein